MSKEIHLIAEQHGDIVEKQQRFEGLSEDVDEVKGRIPTLEDVVALHTQSIDELKRA